MSDELTVIAGILADWQDRIERGEAIDVEAARAAHPELAGELEDGYAALVQLASAEPPSVYAPGEVIADRYEVRAVLGEGATATVYRVFDRSSQEEIAVKRIKGPVGTVEMLRREVQLARKVTHQNVCRVFDIVEHQDGVLLSMELAQGTLASRATEPLDDDAVAEVATQILDGLEAAHAAGVVHRDLKPGNVLVGSDGRLKLSDFGLARSVTQVLASQEGWAGTPAYMAPEQLKGQTPDERADLYAVGLLLYRLRRGHLPFVAPGESVTMPHVVRRLEESIPPLEGSRFASGIGHLLARDPRKRPADVAEARAVLGLGPATQAAFSPVWRWVALLAVLVLGVVGFALWNARGRAPGPVAPGAQAVTRTVLGIAQVIEDPVVFTPDGESVIVAAGRAGAFQLQRVDLDGVRQVPLTDGREPAHAPQLAGGYLYYLHGADLVRIPEAWLTGSEPWAETEAEAVFRGVEHARVASDGRILLVPLGHARRRLDVFDPETLERRILIQDAEPIGSAAWSPDARRVAYGERAYGEAGDAALWLVDASSGERRRLGPAPHFTGLAWTTDGRGLVYFRGFGDERALVHHSLDTGEERVLIPRAPDAALPAVSADGRRAAYLVDPWHYDLWSYAEGRLTQVTNLGDRAAVSPHWVADDDEVIYGVYPPDRLELELRRTRAPAFIESTPVRTIPACFESLAIDPNGASVYYTERRDDGYALVCADLEGTGSPVEILHRTRPVWATEVIPGGFVCYTDESDGHDLWVVAPDGTDPRHLTGRASGGMHAPGGGWLSFQRIGAPTETWIQRLGEAGFPAGEAAAVPGERQIRNARWWPGRPVLVVLDADGIAAIDAESLERTSLLEWPEWIRDPHQLAVHEDGRIVLSLASGGTTVKLVENFAALTAPAREE